MTDRHKRIRDAAANLLTANLVLAKLAMTDPDRNGAIARQETAEASLRLALEPEDYSDIKHSPCAKGLAIAFSKMIREELIDHMPEIIKRNRTYSPDICATHDFCDANMTMEAAFKEFMGRMPIFGEGDDAAEERDAALWGGAWGIAKAAEFEPADII